MKNPYNVLGVTKDASSVAIKRAYRILAQKHHPDRDCGDQEAFQELQEAYQILSDEDSRAYYDRVGEAPKRGPSQYTMAMELIARFFDQWIEAVLSDFALTNSDAVEHVRREINTSLLEGKKANRFLKEHKAKLEFMANRFSMSDSGSNYFNDHINELIGKADAAIENNNKQVAAHDHAIEMLKGATYSPEGGIQNHQHHIFKMETIYGTSTL